MARKKEYVYNFGTKEKPKWFFRRTKKSPKIKIDPFAPDFEIAYGKILAGIKPDPKPKIKTEVTFGQAVRDYFEDGKVKMWAKSRRVNVKSDLDACRDELVNLERPELGTYDTVLLRKMTLRGLVILRDRKLPHLPGAAKNRVRRLRALFRWLKKYGYIPENPAEDLENVKYDSFRIHTWTQDQIDKARKIWPLGSKARLMTELGWHGVPRVDMPNLGPDNIVLRNGRPHLEYRRSKTGEFASIECEPELLACIDGWIPTRKDKNGKPIRVMAKHWLVTNKGRLTYTAKHLGRQFAMWASNAGLPEQCSQMHGLRRACAVRLVAAGVTEAELASMMGWKPGSREAATYLKEANKVILSTNFANRRIRINRGQ